ncbi:hypothetical protein M569_05720, partial [Genlisea aurea]
IWFLLAGIFLLAWPVSPDINSDRAALVALRSAVGGRLLLWNLSDPTCSWAGVTCSSGNSAIVGLRLPAMGLVGQIPANTISNLTNLQTLSLRFNSLSGHIPTELFSSLTVLRNLYLQNNFFDGQIPDSLFSLTSLVRLNLANNNFSGPLSPSFKNLSRLGTLYLQNNHFSGAIPDLNSTALVQFNVSDNNLSGRIPSTLSDQPRNSFTGNLLCGAPLDSCGNEKKSKKLSGGAIAGIVIGSFLGFILILSILFWLIRILAGRSEKTSKDKEGEIEISGGKTEKSFGDSGVLGNAGGKEKKIPGAIFGNGRKALVFLGNNGLSFDLEDLLRASAEVLGKGTFGTTYKAVLETGFSVAVKRLKDVKHGEKEFKSRMEEIGKLHHENLVSLRAYYYNNDEKLLVYDYLPLGSLSALLHGNKGAGRTPLNWETRAAIALGAARGISYLHSQGSSVSHGNIKSSNILLTKSYEARVSDFGLAQLATPTTGTARVAGYRAPEVTDPQKVSQNADVYSFGVLLLELLTAKAPTNSVLNEEGVDLPRWVQSVVREEWAAEVFDVELLRYQSVEEDMVQLLELAVDCTAQHPDNRPSMEVVTTKIEDLCRRSMPSPGGDIEED